jgi:hypothetical protein
MKSKIVLLMALFLVTPAAASSAKDVCWCWCSVPNPNAKVGCWHGEQGSCRAQRGAASCVSEIRPIWTCYFQCPVGGTTNKRFRGDPSLLQRELLQMPH